jgi:hypothetical protein
MGISKRLPNAAVAEKMIEPNTVVFVAHDEGEYHECPDCVGLIECPECRKRDEKILRLKIEREDYCETEDMLTKKIDRLEMDLANAEERDADLTALEEKIKELKTKAKRAATATEKRSVKIHNLIADNMNCGDCDGEGTMSGGTGGKVVFGNDEVWEYRKYNYWLHLPKKWTAEKEDGIALEEMCPSCGGTGRLPNGRIFGLFLPSATEYVLKPEDDEALKNEIETKGIWTVDGTVVESEKKRGCGKRKAGGFYAITDPKKATADVTLEKVKEMIDAGLLSYEEVNITGNFVEFLSPVEIASKRFRGIKRWSLDPEAEEEAEMALEGLED